METMNLAEEKGFVVSESLWEWAQRLIPSGTQTLSKAPNQFVEGVTPKYLRKGANAHVWDVDGNEYIDYPLALGPIILGYNYAPVVEAVTKQITQGTTFTLMHPLEVEVAELVATVVPSAEMVRFAKNGADVTSAAVRVARAYTGRDHIAYCGYHGCQDWYAITTPRNKGIPEVLKELIHPFEYNSIDSLKALFEQYPEKIACVIMEVPGVDPCVYEESGRNFLQEVKELAHKNGALFILDEIVTGFRYATGGAQEYYGVEPDLCCLGKAMGNGFPISAIAGKKEFMKELEEVFFSMTFSGETVGLAAAKATIEELIKKPVIDEIWRKGERLHTGLNMVAREWNVPFEITGKPPRGTLVFRNSEGGEDLILKSLFLQETVKRGILFGGPVFICYTHTDEDIDKTIQASFEAFRLIRDAIDSGRPEDYLEGKPITTVFRQRR